MAVRFSFHKHFICSTFFCAALLFVGQIRAQDTTAIDSDMERIEANIDQINGEMTEKSPENRPPQRDANLKTDLREIKNETWAEATKNLDYSQDAKKQTVSAPSANLPDWGFNTKIVGGLLQGSIIVSGLALIGFLIFKIVAGARSKTVKPAEMLDISSLDDLENRLFESDLQKMLRQAKESGQFGLAIRVHYLMIIRQLSEKNYIKFRREKTNRNYLNELAASQFAADFRKITPIYEQIWYGELPISAEDFARIEPDFEAFFRRI
jgi:hypothetical protein